MLQQQESFTVCIGVTFSFWSTCNMLHSCSKVKSINCIKNRYLYSLYKPNMVAHDELFKDFFFKITLLCNYFKRKSFHWAMLGPWQFMNLKQSVIKFPHLYCCLAVHGVKFLMSVTSIKSSNPYSTNLWTEWQTLTLADNLWKHKANLKMYSHPDSLSWCDSWTFPSSHWDLRFQSSICRIRIVILRLDDAQINSKVITSL